MSCKIEPARVPNFLGILASKSFVAWPAGVFSVCTRWSREGSLLSDDADASKPVMADMLY